MEHEKKLEVSASRVEDSADRRTTLAANRDRLRRGADLCGLDQDGAGCFGKRRRGQGGHLRGVVPDWVVLSTGTLLVFFSVFCFGAAVWRELDTGAVNPAPEVRRIPRSVLIAVNALLALVSLFALVGIWLGRTGKI